VFLKTLTLKGFKSFADATVLDMEPGVTVVVGPNGSGKSNVVDAVAWVLGAQAPSAVRSQKMDDVIFAGTATRPALGRAEVSLTIDNGAGLLPVDFTEVTLTRTLWRSGDSEYAINGVPCRMLDIQELLSDSGVGRQQHVIISQGQIDAVLNARPEDRRLVIEEAAGILKYRRRKEKAERRLAGTEASMLRLQDLLREVRRQLRPLERQAEAARRHGDLVSELTALRLHLAGRELAGLRSRRHAAEALRRDLRDAEAESTRALAEADATVLATEAQLTTLGEVDLGDDLARAEALRERARGLGAVLAERARGLEHQRGVQVDEAVVASLEAESARLDGELAAVRAERDGLAPDRDRVAEAEAELGRRRQELAGRWPGSQAEVDREEGPTRAGPSGPDTTEAPPRGGAATVRSELAAVRAAIDQGEGERRRIEERASALDARAVRLADEHDRLARSLSEAESATTTLTATAEATATLCAEAEAEVDAADEQRRRDDADHHRWVARADALALALDQARSEAGAEHLSEVAGVLGTLRDLVAVDDGWEAAFDAAAGAAVAAVVVDGADAARQAVATLARVEQPGAVVPLAAARSVVGDRHPNGSGAGEPLRAHVHASREPVGALLDELLGRVRVVADWSVAIDAVLADPGALVVTRDGGRFGPDGWRVGAAGSGATGAALDEARSRAADAERNAAAAAERASRARRARDEGRAAESEAGRVLDRVRTQRAALGEALRRSDADRIDLTSEIDTLRAQLTGLDERVGRDEARLATLGAELPDLEAGEERRARERRAAAADRERLDARTAEVAALRADLEVRMTTLDQHDAYLSGRRAEVDERLSRHGAERDAAETRRVDLERRERAVTRLAELVADRLGRIDTALAALRDRRRRQSDSARAVAAEMQSARARRAEVEQALEATRARRLRAEVDISEVTVRVENAVEVMRRDLDVDPDTALRAPLPAVPEGTTAATRARELERELRLLGPVNPLALEEFTALQERHDHVEGQLDDVRAARRDLAKIIRAIDGEIVTVFAAAYADVEANFRSLFETLFPGGQGRIALTQPDDLLSTGVELEAKPSGKNIKKLSLLSGGERSLTALAYLFAVFRARPSPFYVMDEVEAALDDVNLHRFLGLVAEFRADAQLIIVSHQKRTMEAADLLYGVTMAPGGSSQVLAEKATAAP